MPYASTSDLPPAVREKYSGRCLSVFRSAFNANHKDGEEKAFRIAHSAARRCMEAKSVDHLTLPEAKFNVFSGLLKAVDAGDGKKRIKTVASSTLEDRQGDQLTLKALQSMADSAVGMTVFLNHSYKVPEDVFGIVEKASINQRGDEFDLDFDVEVEEDNPRALATHKSVVRGVKLGTSIGAQILPGGAWKDATRGVTIIDDVALLEASIVGIPANPRSFVHYAMKALDETMPEEAEEAQVTVTTNTASNSVTVKVMDPPLPEDPAAEEPSADESTTPETPEGAESPETVEPEPETAQEGDEPAPESADDGTTKAIEPEKPPLEVSELDTYDVGDEAKALLSMKQADFATLLKMVETTTSDLVEAKKALWEAQKSVKALESERDAANANVELAKQFVNKLAELPIGRRASHSAVISSFQDRFSGIYDPDVIKMLTSGENSNG